MSDTRTARIIELCLEAGFDTAGIAPPILSDRARNGLAEFIELGHYGEMQWMADKADLRADPKAVWPEVKSIIMLGHNYGPEHNPMEMLAHKDTGVISAYAQHRDYHDVMKKRMRELAGRIAKEFSCDVKIFVDTAPIMEKPLAEAAGIGWAGKHTCIVSREFGSWLFLGEIFTTLDLPPTSPLPERGRPIFLEPVYDLSLPHPEEPRSGVSKDNSVADAMVRDGLRPPHHEVHRGNGKIVNRLLDASHLKKSGGDEQALTYEQDAPPPYPSSPREEGIINHCGSCTRCLDICPTQAFSGCGKLDARKCIAYLTIEHKGHIPVQYRKAMGNRIYGCDDCLAICPWNKFAKASQEAAYHAREDLKAPKLRDLVTLDDAQFRRFFSGSPVKRIGRNRFIRNVLIAIGNSEDTSLTQHITHLQHDESELVREAAAWALEELRA